MAVKTDKPVSVTTKKTRETVSVVVDGKKHHFPSTPPLDLTLTILEADGQPDQRQIARILTLFRDQVLPEELRKNLDDLEDILEVFKAWSETVGLENTSGTSPTKKPQKKSSADTGVR